MDAAQTGRKTTASSAPPKTFASNIVASGQRAAARTDTSAGSTTRKARFEVWRGSATSGQLQTYSTSVSEGMVVLDAIHQIQSESASDLAVRWNCKAGKCGSCSAEINGVPRLMCMTRLSELDLSSPVTVEPMRAFPLVRDLVTDVSSNFRAKKKIRKFTPRPADAPDGTWRMQQSDADRVQEFRKCIECFLCQDVCHVLRDHQLHERFVGPRLLVHAAQLEMHPLDSLDRTPDLKESHGIGYCNITKCCTKVCPEHITITDNAIIPLKERVADQYYDPLRKLVRLVRGKKPMRKEPERSKSDERR
jgi:succinate dehydrogenase / fumarate reductase iron-sulfur subunit